MSETGEILPSYGFGHREGEPSGKDRVRSLTCVLGFLCVFLVFLTSMLVLVFVAHAFRQEITVEQPTIVFLNFTVWTGDARTPFAQAIAIRNNRILDIGSNAFIIERYDLFDTEKMAGNIANLTIVDAYYNYSAYAAPMIVPGFIDSHIHMYTGGMVSVCVCL